MPATAAVVLAGGRSSRMGAPKAELEWHGSTLLRRVVGLVSRGVDGPVVVVRAAGQPLPPLPPSVEVLEDSSPGSGPLEGMATGLLALQEQAEHAFVCSTDLPLLHPAFVRAVCRAAQEVDVALPVLDGHRQPLCACYRTALGVRARELLAVGRPRPAFLLEGADVRELDAQTLLSDTAVASGDPRLVSVTGTNTPEEYHALRAQPAPPVTVQRFGVLARGGQSGDRTVPAATLGAAARAVDLMLDRHVLAAVNGDQMVRDPELPLAAGDVVAFLSADAGG
jgi:molybdopterin-guanine dinucleotide biosynthesis protein A